MGRQIDLECLRVESRFINGHMLVICIPAERRASPQILYSQGISSLDWSTGLDWL